MSEGQCTCDSRAGFMGQKSHRREDGDHQCTPASLRQGLLLSWIVVVCFVHLQPLRLTAFPAIGASLDYRLQLRHGVPEREYNRRNDWLCFVTSMWTSEGM